MNNEQPDTDDFMLLEAYEAPDPYGNTLSAEQAGAILNCSAQKVRGMARRGELEGALVNGPKGKQWRIKRTGLLAPREVDPMALAGATFPQMTVANYGELFQLVRELRSKNDEMHEEIARLREAAAADRARAEVALQLAAAPTSEVPKKRPWWKVWERVE